MANSPRNEVSVGQLAAPIKNALVGGPFGSDLGTAHYLPTGVPVIRGQNLSDRKLVGGDFVFVSERKADELKANLAHPGDLVFTQRGNAVLHGGQVSIVPTEPFKRYLVSQSQMKLTADPSKADPHYLYYVFTSADFTHYLRSNAVVTGVPHINLRLLREYRVALPSIAEQNRIAEILGALDDKIELNRRMNGTLEAMARALFQSWFVDFDPVRAKLDGRVPVGMDAETAALFPDGFEESALGQIPKGWRAGSVYEAADVIYGAPFASSEFNAEKRGKPLIRIRDLPSENPAVFTTEVHPKGYLLHAGDIAVGMDGEFRAYLWAGEQSWLNQRVCVFAPKPGYSAAFVRNSILAPLAHIEATETATTVIHLGKGDIDRFALVIPDQPLARAFERHCQPLYDKIVANKQQSRILTTMRDALLPELLSGNLRIN